MIKFIIDLIKEKEARDTKNLSVSYRGGYLIFRMNGHELDINLESVYRFIEMERLEHTQNLEYLFMLLDITNETLDKNIISTSDDFYLYDCSLEPKLETLDLIEGLDDFIKGIALFETKGTMDTMLDNLIHPEVAISLLDKTSGDLDLCDEDIPLSASIILRAIKARIPVGTLMYKMAEASFDARFIKGNNKQVIYKVNLYMPEAVAEISGSFANILKEAFKIENGFEVPCSVSTFRLENTY